MVGTPALPQELQFGTTRCYASIMDNVLSERSGVTVAACTVVFAADAADTLTVVDNELFVRARTVKIPLTDSSVVCTEPVNGKWYVYVPEFLSMDALRKLHPTVPTGIDSRKAALVLQITVSQ